VAETHNHTDRRGPDAVGSIVKRYRKRDDEYTYGLRIRAYGERHWVPLGTEREGWNDVRAADRRDEITGLVRRGVWRPPNAFQLDPRERNPGFHEFATDWLKRFSRTVKPRTAETAEYLGCAGLRNSEACALNVGDLDVAHGVINVRDAKTEAGIRKVYISPWLRDELASYRATRPDAPLDAPAFPTRSGSRRDKGNVNARVLRPAVRAANELRRERGEPLLPGRVTPHTLRRTFITLMLEAGAPVHEDATTTLNIYAQVLKRRDRQRHGEAFDALMAGAVPSGATFIMSRLGSMPSGSSGSGHRNPAIGNL